MEGDRVAPLVGIVGCLGTLAGLLYPYLTAEGPGVGSYYGTGAVNPLVAGVLALVTIIVLAAGRERRSDPGIAAAVGLVFGVAMVAILLLWGTSVRVDAILVSPFHRWIVLGLAGLVPVGSAWYARALGFF
jgi:hypothetical protein